MTQPTLHELLREWIEGDPELRGHVRVTNRTSYGSVMLYWWIQLACVDIHHIGLYVGFVCRIESDHLLWRKNGVNFESKMLAGEPNFLPKLKAALIHHHNWALQRYDPTGHTI